MTTAISKLLRKDALSISVVSSYIVNILGWGGGGGGGARATSTKNTGSVMSSMFAMETRDERDVVMRQSASSRFQGGGHQ